jgi:hypothetical protein
MKLSIKAFALAFGLIWGVGVFLLIWWIIAFDGATGEPTLIGQLYRGYSISPLGSVLGLCWGFADGVIGGVVFAWLYNGLVEVFERRCESQTTRQADCHPGARGE